MPGLGGVRPGDIKMPRVPELGERKRRKKRVRIPEPPTVQSPPPRIVIHIHLHNKGFGES